MKKVSVLFTSKITQENESEVFEKNFDANLDIKGAQVRLHYFEDKNTPVKMLIQNKEVIIFRGDKKDSYSVIHLVLNEEGKCKYVVQGHKMDLTSKTNKLYLDKKDKIIKQLKIEYQLFNGLYLIGNYTVKLIFTY